MVNKKFQTLASVYWILQCGPRLKSVRKSGERYAAFLHAKRSTWSSHV